MQKMASHTPICHPPRWKNARHDSAGLTLLAMSLTAILASVSPGQSTNSTRSSPELAALEKSTSRLAQDKFELRYKFRAGETVYYEVVHQTAVETKVDGNTETVKSRSKSLKRWDFGEESPQGHSQFSHTIDFVNMWSEMSGRKPIRYDSRVDAEPPSDYDAIAKTLGVPISTITADVQGKIIARDDQVKQIDRGTGGLLVPLPPTPIKLKTEWGVPASVTVQLSDGRYQEIKTRQRYRLENVATGIATMSLTTQVLTPVSDARVRSQLVQKLSQGTIKFDIDAGRMISKELNWDETVIGFNGPESNMSFLATMTERLVTTAEVARLKDGG